MSGLENVGTFDPFEDIDILFEGSAPNGTAQLVESDNKITTGLIFTLDKTKELSNGDTVTVTVGANTSNLTDYCIQNYGMIPSSTEKTFTVSGLDYYVDSISDISEEALAEMKAQAKDVYDANETKRNDDTEKFQGITYLGSYLLTAKNPSGVSVVHNYFYLVYKASYLDQISNDNGMYRDVNNVYWYIRYTNLIATGSGETIVDVMNYRSPFNTGDRFTVDSNIRDGWTNRTWRYYGFESLDDLYKNVVTAQAENFNHEDAVQDVATAPIAPVTAIVVEDGTDESAAEESAAEDETEVEGESTAEGESAAEDAVTLQTEAAADNTAGAIFPDSSTRVLTTSEITPLSDEDLRYAINELYARHGYIFNDTALLNYFRQFDWYEETVPSSSWDDSMFNSIEYQNVQLLGSERDRR